MLKSYFEQKEITIFRMTLSCMFSFLHSTYFERTPSPFEGLPWSPKQGRKGYHMIGIFFLKILSPSKSFVKKNADPKPHIHLSHFSSGDGLDEFVVFQAFTCCDLWLVTCKWQNPYCLVSSDWILGSFLWVQIREVFTGLVTLDGTSSACGVGELN